MTTTERRITLTARQVQALRAIASGDEPNRTISIPNAIGAALTVIRQQAAELEYLRTIEKRLNDAERWTRGAGAFEKSVGQREAVRYALYGEVPS